MTNRHAEKPSLRAGATNNLQLPGRVVLVLQGGGALGAYQVGVYEALHAAGIEPEWVIGTSIGAINGALIAGNKPADRMEKLLAFWEKIEQQSIATRFDPFGVSSLFSNITTVLNGIPSFFKPNPAALLGNKVKLGVEKASYYSTEPLARTLCELVDFGQINGMGKTRLTVGAVNVNSGMMRYFDSSNTHIDAKHIMASGALPPAFGAIRIEDAPYWDGGIYSNTPIEAVLDDNPRRNSLIFAVNVWHQSGPEPESIADVLARQKDIQFASRADSHIEKQKQIHRLRHVIRELGKQLPASKQNEACVKELTAWGCGTTMHVAHLVAPRLDDEDQSKDIDFSFTGVNARRAAGYADTLRMIERAPWREGNDSIEGIIEYRSCP
ncbi:patatin-like phospholipase family protein [Solimicrobium silvestre]|uniref:Patatin phospholipase n=1 Tax=Solimicrobium silvestre TaxID=2099400 RepID=A0A2S9GWD0_9BURK|nr:patatin-like phospholipase family protein [Solimicrobium silvestre]PRC91966.1 Patatin phospholipase [Solimicrobium silvestre]